MALDLEAIISKSLTIAEQLGVLVTATYEPFSSQDAYGQASYGAPVSVKGMLDLRARMVRSAEGTEIPINGTLIVQGAVVPTEARTAVQGRLTLPSGQQPPLLDVQTYHASSGVVLQEVRF